MDQNLKNKLVVLNQMCKAVNSQINEDDRLRKIYDLLGKLMPVDFFSFGSYDKKGAALDWKFLTDSGKSLETVSEALPEIVKEVMIKQECLFASSPEIPASYAESILGKNNNDVQSIIVSPVFGGGKVSGVLALKNRSRNYTEEDAHLLSIACSQLGISKLESHKLEGIIEEKKHLQSVVELAGFVGHEMNQPLTGIAGYCALIKEDIDEADPIYKDIQQIEKQGARLEKLVYKFQNIVDLEKRKSIGSEKN